MDFAAQIKSLSARIPSLLDSILTEEATKQYLLDMTSLIPKKSFPSSMQMLELQKNISLTMPFLKMVNQLF
jgi:hypothetical protein